MGMNNYDFIVIGSGPAGRRAAIQAAKLGHSVLVVEKGRRVGGVSVHTGTIPSKTLRETVLNLTGWRERGFYGRAYRVKKDIEAKDLMMRLHMTLDHEVDVLEHQFARNAVHTLRGMARFLDPHRIEVTLDSGDVRVIERRALPAGRRHRPYRPADVPFDGHTVLDSDEIVDIDQPAAQPDRDRRRALSASNTPPSSARSTSRRAGRGAARPSSISSTTS